MISVSSCPICASTKVYTYQAIVSGFLAERIWEKEPGDVQLCHCRVCGFTYFNPRLESDELKRLYNGYRDSEYQKMRQRYEPKYTEEFNAALGSDPQELRLRKDLLREYLKLEIKLDDIKSVLDYGGDRGQFIIDELSNAKRYVYEISGIPPEPGIESLLSIEECKKRRYDLIMCCHVLEHVPDPLGELSQIVDLADTETMIYIELPYDTPFKELRALMSRRLRLSDLMSFSPVLAVIITRFSSVKPRMHEHINFFNGASLHKTLTSFDLDVLQLDVPDAEIGPMHIRIVRCLARKKLKR